MEAGHNYILSLLSEIIVRQEIIKLAFILCVKVHDFRLNKTGHAIFVCGKSGGLFNSGNRTRRFDQSRRFGTILS